MAPGLLSPLRASWRRVPGGLLIGLFGLMLIAAAWFEVLHRDAEERAFEIARIQRENGSLARAFEEHVRRVIQTADSALLFLQHEYETHGWVTEGLIGFVDRSRLDPILNRIELADSRGDLLLGAVAHVEPVNISRFEHFQVHAASNAKGLFIGKPIVAQGPGTWSFSLSRRLSGPGGSFLGVVSVRLDPAYFSSYYDDPELGRDLGILLLGQDGIVRARRSQLQSEIGQDLSASALFDQIRLTPNGHCEVAGVIDDLRRFVSYRTLPDYPLIITVFNLTASAFAPLEHRALGYRLSALIFSLFVTLFCLVLHRAERRAHRQNADLTSELAERHKAEAALRESRDLFSAFLDHIPAVVFVQDLQGRILFSNQRFKDLEGPKAIGANARELLAPAPDGPPGKRPALRGSSVTLDETVIDGAGRTRIFETRMFVVELTGQEPLLGCVSVDGTGRRRAEEERLAFERRMQQTQKLESLGVLAGGIAHDFNNLLMIILGNADLALAKASAESPLRCFLRNIDMAAQRAADLANQMLAYSGKGRFLIEPINLSRLVEEMGHLLSSVISKRATAHYRLAEEMPLVLADATQIRQVVMNLLTNASDAIGEREGVITITTGVVEVGPPRPAPEHAGPPLPAGTYAFIEVSDTGSGMDPATQVRIFDPFYTTKHTGRGLGLASVLGIVRGHNGEIRVSSDPGRGTIFTVLLPTAPPVQAGTTAVLEPPEPEPPAGRSRGMVLVVDDEQQVLQTARFMLEESGFTVVTAADGVEGVAVFQDRAAHLSAVVLDMNMPRMDGAEAFREMRGIAPDVPVILTSGFDEGEAVSHFTGTGLAGFIQKPYRMKALIEKIESAIAAGTAPSAP